MQNYTQAVSSRRRTMAKQGLEDLELILRETLHRNEQVKVSSCAVRTMCEVKIVGMCGPRTLKMSLNFIILFLKRLGL